ncbi:ATP-sensitive inward rectifier potassium channel 8-like isoform X2 [Leptidea sinapis]|nr:ATP-sensitive inward rectifier potassium channel 8-like isoform X2 [Leptidea sinapis]XP_050673163.1 ATP-sensitive inward rectifier potassium channel 8-like isoform X2 [Leptidea sinapis]XP_050673164.1 ATP-sensitive inward rectifier potassium channel 8-like isoform X2 [Leptidea sinapis]XP_050673165.1 ATP-sensitive inward rectifier potassium channel 8-like isoform X2 [Leptidea sinapis]XP_050673166.1 ATP-sensitive inward rectifier potassium channel 8-like isoform X2 [Leptidea sinapis]
MDCGDEWTQFTDDGVSVIKPGVYQPRLVPGDQHANIQRRNMRVMFKNGDINICHKRNRRVQDFSNYIVALVEARWRWTLLNFCSAFLFIWLFFGVLYWIISYNHGDFAPENLPQNQSTSNFTACVKNFYGFTSAFLFSIEVDTTVAYGKRAITLECPQTITTMCLQCIVSSIFQAVMVGILFAKLTRPRGRTKTILFSRHAVINLRNDKFCLIFRVGDMRKSRILNIRPKAYVIRYKTESKVLDISDQIELNVDVDECESTFFLWPITVVHQIDESSPFYRLSAADLLCCKLEILTVFEGVVESTGQPVQARSSFTEYDVFWGHRFASMVGYNTSRMMYEVDFSMLSEIQQVDTPLCSACEYDSLLLTLSHTPDDYYEPN